MTKVPLELEGVNVVGDWSPDARSLAYYRQQRGRLEVLVRSLVDGTDRNLGVTIRPATPPGPRWSPDGRSLLIQATDERNQQGIFVVSVESGDVEALVKALPREELWGPRWLPDGRSILFARFEQDAAATLVVREIDSGDERVVYTDRHLHGWDLAPDGSMIAVSTDDTDAEAENPVDELVRLVSVATGQVRELARIPTTARIQVLRWTPEGQAILTARPVVEADRQRGEVIRISAATGEVRATALLQPMNPSKLFQLSQFRFHPDGRQVLLPAGDSSNEIWTMEHFLPVLGGSR